MSSMFPELSHSPTFSRLKLLAMASENVDPALRKEVRAVMRDLLDESELTQAEVAERMGIRSSSLSEMLSVKKRFQDEPSISKVAAFADALETDLGYILVKAGWLPPQYDIESGIKTDPELSPEDADELIAFYRWKRRQVSAKERGLERRIK